MADLEDDESGDNTWNATPKGTKTDFTSDSAKGFDFYGVTFD